MRRSRGARLGGHGSQAHSGAVDAVEELGEDAEVLETDAYRREEGHLLVRHAGPVGDGAHARRDGAQLMAR
eukprot:6175181-Pleurochrysis_carterae.AAC.3